MSAQIIGIWMLGSMLAAQSWKHTQSASSAHAVSSAQQLILTQPSQSVSSAAAAHGSEGAPVVSDGPLSPESVPVALPAVGSPLESLGVSVVAASVVLDDVIPLVVIVASVELAVEVVVGDIVVASVPLSALELPASVVASPSSAPQANTRVDKNVRAMPIRMR